MRRDDQPLELGRVLETLAGRLRRVDLRIIDEIQAMWPTIVDPAVAEHCHPRFVKDGVLLVSVPSGAFAQRVTEERDRILAGFASLGDKAPTALRTVLEQA